MTAETQAAYRERQKQGAYYAGCPLMPDLLEMLIDAGCLHEAVLDIEDWRARRRELDLALARYLYAQLGRVMHNAPPNSCGLD